MSSYNSIDREFHAWYSSNWYYYLFLPYILCRFSAALNHESEEIHEKTDGDGNGLLSGTDNCFVYFPDTCRQCEDPACGNACPQKAIITNEQGIRVVDTDKCIGCGACVEACPWHMPTVNPETGKSSKCIACGACVAGCPSGALSIVDWDAVTSAAQAAYKDL